MPLSESLNSSAPHRLQTGVNLIELLIVLVIAGVLLGVALPAGQGMLERGQLRAATNEVYSALLFARNEATRLRQQTQLCFITDATADKDCSSSGTSLLGVFSDATPNNKPVRVFEIDSRVTVTLAQDDEIEFQRLGNLSSGNATYFSLQVGDHQRQVEACFNGRIMILNAGENSKC